ncbi:OLC1v1019414C1 [Oldenlandia corymbosa var. corymbosa]|uniref:OLC1v1019414C1 n=1 Tax=Oldenlandia corymbosa var. corymbosa TaxID=529605 RepID=A0AAV1EDV2_OLDCO|nr:OLC1v1019414C1 [Oldenlandia corymbosa var. corymbosa]
MNNNNKNDRATDRYLPIEIIMEILSRVHAKTLGRWKLVCKLWRAIIQDNKFSKLHGKNAELEIVYKDLNRTANDLRNETFLFLHCVDGVFLEVSDLTGNLQLRNPLTKHTLPLPQVPDGDGEEFDLMRMFYLPKTDNYKIICCKNGGGFWVLTVSMDLHWRAIEEADEQGVTFPALSTVAVVDADDVYFLIRPTDDNISPGHFFSDVVCLEVETETLLYTQCPKTFWQTVGPFSWNQKLALASFEKGTELNLWVLEDYKKSGKWSEMKILLPSTLFGDFPPELMNLMPIAEEDHWLLLRRADHCLLVYNTKTGQEQARLVIPAGKSFRYSYVPSLSTLNGNLIPPEGARNHVFSCFTDHQFSLRGGLACWRLLLYIRDFQAHFRSQLRPFPGIRANLEKRMELHVWVLEDYKKSGKWSEIKILLPSTLFGG